MATATRQHRRRYRSGISTYEARGAWRGWIALDDGRKVYRSGATEAEVERKLKEAKTAADGLDVADASVTLGQALDQWLAEITPETTSPNTTANRRWAMTHLAPRERLDDGTVEYTGFGAVKLVDLKTRTVKNFLAEKVAEGLGRSSVGRLRAVLVQALDWCQGEEMVTKNVARITKVPSAARAPKTGRSMTPEQAVDLYRAALDEPVLGPIVVVALRLGLRPGEVLGLGWDDIDFDERVLTIARSLKRNIGADGSATLMLGPPKAESYRRYRLPEDVVEVLHRHQSDQRRARMAARRWPTITQDGVEVDLVFRSERGGPLDQSNYRKSLGRFTERLGLGTWSPNELRKTFLTLADEWAGVRIEDVSAAAGHTSPNMTREHYIHRTAPSAVPEALDGLFGT